jgi:hypothetical protein
MDSITGLEDNEHHGHPSTSGMPGVGDLGVGFDQLQEEQQTCQGTGESRYKPLA